MPKTFFFYDLETSGLSGRQDRIMQFAGQRTDMDLQPIGQPFNVLVALNDDTLPSPDALMVTGITPQETVANGYTEAEFTQMLLSDVFIEDTITVGFNNIRFDDEFIRHLLWRNFRDPYEWTWRDGRSRWDLLDVVRMTRALRPTGIKWPVVDGKPSNRLELITKENNIDHQNAHDAMSDVDALIAITALVKTKQPQLFSYMLKMRDKNEIKKLVNLEDKQPFVYTSGKYDSKFQKTTVAFPLTAGKNGNVIVYDLRIDPSAFIDMSLKDLSKIFYASWEDRQSDEFVGLPVKELQYNRAPAVAPLSVLDKEEGWHQLSLEKNTIDRHLSIVLASPHFAENIRTLFEGKPEYKKYPDPESQLYDSFLNDSDKLRVQAVAEANEAELSDLHPEFQDERLPALLLHYKARNYPRSLSLDEAAEWEKWRVNHLQVQLASYAQALERLSTKPLSEKQQFVFEELQLWYDNIAPSDMSQ